MAEEKTIEVKEIVIQIGKTDAHLTVDQARKLHEALGQLLGVGPVIIPVPSPYPVPYYPPTYPFWRITWSSDQSTSGTSITNAVAATYTVEG